MDCDSIRAAISASLDGEDPGLPADVTRSHLGECAACRAWRERQHVLTRRVRLGGYALEHDLAERVVAALPAGDGAARRSTARESAGAWGAARAGAAVASSAVASSAAAGAAPAGERAAIPMTRRVALALVAIAQLAITVPLLIFGHDRDAGMHAAHELGSFDLALSIAFVVGVLRPKLSAGLAWPCCVAALGLAGTAVIDMIGGQTFGADEAQHLVAVVGALLLFWQSRTISSRTIPADPLSAAPAASSAGSPHEAAAANAAAADAVSWDADGTRADQPGGLTARKEDAA